MMFQRSKKYVGYNDLWLMLIGIPLMSFVVDSILFTDLITHKLWKEFSMCGLIGFIHVFLFWIVFREIYFYGIKKFGRSNKRYFFVITGIIIGYAIVKLMINIFLKDYIYNAHDYAGPPHPFLEGLTSFLVTTIVILIYEGGYLTNTLQLVELEKQQLESKNIASQLEGLKNKVSPHFLFNSLNTLCNLIPESPERAERFVRKLSKVYRYILEIRDKKLISLKEELEYLEAYTILLKERFGDNIHINIDVQEHFYNKNIVPLSLQILMENAIKHNIISRDQPLHIHIYVDQVGKLVVKNNLQKKRSVPNSTKFGLENIKDRYQFFTDAAVEVIPTVEQFIVILPLIKAT